jgi:Flp pilus assembly protein TadG
MRNLTPFIRRFWRDTHGAAAAEMAMIAPFLIVLTFGSLELGKYFWDSHVLAKAVRDGARYAARQRFSEYSACAASGTVVTNTRAVTMTGLVSGGTPHLSGWTDATTVAVTAACGPTSTYEGIYKQLGSGPPIVTVQATVPFATFGFTTGLMLRARSQAAVTGI